jgi:sugar fermentation stimulation protein A
MRSERWYDRTMDSGCYIAVLFLAEPRRIRVGRLGTWDFPAGTYFYAGSAQRGLKARIERHARRRKPKRWHLDYLSAHATLLGALLCPGPKATECALASDLAQLFDIAVPHFGSSDCRCPGHLFFARDWM